MPTPIDRRGFVAGLAVALVLGPAGMTRAFAPARRLDEMALDDLLALRGHSVRLHAEDGTAAARVRGVDERDPTGPFRQIELMLESDVALPQGVHRIEHDGTVSVPLLVVPVVHPADDPDAPSTRAGRYAYQITFVRDARA